MKHTITLVAALRLTPLATLVAALGAASMAAQEPAPAPAAAAPVDAAREKLIARGKSLELPTTHELVPGDPLSHHASGFAKTMCSAVFITGYDIAFAAEHVGYFTAPYEARAKMGKPVVDMVKKTVSVSLPNGTVRTAVYTGSQGCITYEEGSDKLNFTPETIKPNLPPADSQDWPMGDRLPATPLPEGVDEAKVKAAVMRRQNPLALRPPLGNLAA